MPAATTHSTSGRFHGSDFDYEQKPKPSFPVLDTMKPRYDMWLLERYGLPAMYWHGMLRGPA
ncbi:hypothetical protein [Micromonospora sp. NPDC005806]|uniref:hypothetical protein n=1 Tax=Micromonospora sp. NPDC005806 TaxID=3364234 RepID=UPI00368BA0FF